MKPRIRRFRGYCWLCESFKYPGSFKAIRGIGKTMIDAYKSWASVL